MPPVTASGQTLITFELVGTGFDPGEPVTIKLVPLPLGNQSVSPYRP